MNCLISDDYEIIDMYLPIFKATIVMYDHSQSVIFEMSMISTTILSLVAVYKIPMKKIVISEE